MELVFRCDPLSMYVHTSLIIKYFLVIMNVCIIVCALLSYTEMKLIKRGKKRGKINRKKKNKTWRGVLQVSFFKGPSKSLDLIYFMSRYIV